jgi:hypothetical protein
MPMFAIALPLRPGQENSLKELGGELAGTRRGAFDESEKRLGIPKESWFLQRAESGSLVIVTFEADDPGRALTEFSRSRDAFDLWFKGRVKEITGVDLNGPLPPPPEEIVRYPR